eukprot:TRINITY_DN11396_c0_g1_i1.p1 TRINITY_DN11396_c0_g1~~TRINITY_DN11396_c0_g1_i1.p1  ORF type:complete len:116 (-),score=23.05 TRINITY_DN11396_c0_g1_i1:71-397(-)
MNISHLICAENIEPSPPDDSICENEDSYLTELRKRTPRRVRRLTPGIEASYMKKIFEVTKYPSVETRLEIAKRFGIHPRKVQIWFQNRRASEHREQTKANASATLEHH